MKPIRYSYDIKDTSGKELVIADLLSRSPLPEDDTKLSEEVLYYVQGIIEYYVRFVKKNEDGLC